MTTIPLLVSLLGLLSLGAASAAIATDFSKALWEPMSDEDRIAVWRWDVPDSDVFAFKAIGIIDQPVGKVGAVLIDITREKEWIPDLAESRIVRQVSRTERIEYSHMNTPIVVKDRDFVMDAKAEFDAKRGVLVLSFESVEDAKAPPTKYVRGMLHSCSYTLRPVQGGKATEVTFLVHVDPAGSVPKWIVNFFQKNFPRDTLEAIRKQASKADILENQEIKGLFEKPKA